MIERPPVRICGRLELIRMKLIKRLSTLEKVENKQHTQHMSPVLVLEAEAFRERSSFDSASLWIFSFKAHRRRLMSFLTKNILLPALMGISSDD